MTVVAAHGSVDRGFSAGTAAVYTASVPAGTAQQCVCSAEGILLKMSKQFSTPGLDNGEKMRKIKI